MDTLKSCQACRRVTDDIYHIDPETGRYDRERTLCAPCFERLHMRCLREAMQDPADQETLRSLGPGKRCRKF